MINQHESTVQFQNCECIYCYKFSISTNLGETENKSLTTAFLKESKIYFKIEIRDDSLVRQIFYIDNKQNEIYNLFTK